MGQGNMPAGAYGSRLSLAKNYVLQKQDVVLVEEGGFEPPKPKQQIYSLPPLATRELFRKINFSIYIEMELVDGLEPPTC